MAESPDFEQIARDVFKRGPTTVTLFQNQSDEQILNLADALREVWNARGAADAKAVADRLRQDGGAICEFNCAHVADAAIKELDR